MARTLRITAVLLGLGLSLPSVDAAAQGFDESKAAVRGAARFLAVQGDEALHAGQYEEALRLFRMAEELYHAPTLVLAMAQAERRLERWAEARDHYRAVIDEKMDRGTNPAFHQAKLTAKQELKVLEPKIPTLQLTLKAATARAEVRLDGKARPLESLREPLYLDVGEHDVVVIDEGEVRAQKVTLKSGERRELTIDLSEGGGVSSSMTRPPEVEPPIGWWWGAGALGLGAVGLAAGTVTGILALDEADAVKASCTNGLACDPTLQPREDDARALATGSTAAFVLGGIFVATGATLLVLDATLEPDTEVGLVVGPTWAGVEGRF